MLAISATYEVWAVEKRDSGLVLLFVGGLIFAFGLLIHNMLMAKDGDMFFLVAQNTGQA